MASPPSAPAPARSVVFAEYLFTGFPAASRNSSVTSPRPFLQPEVNLRAARRILIRPPHRHASATTAAPAFAANRVARLQQPGRFVGARRSTDTAAAGRP